MYGCEFCVIDKTTYTEYCAINGEDTNGAVMCDFEYERCPLRASAQGQGQEQQDNVNEVNNNLIDEIDDLLTEFDEMGYEPTAGCPNPAEEAINFKRRLIKRLLKVKL